MSYNSELQANNEELREILQQVYDLPNANSSVAEPDLVIGLDTSDYFTINGKVECLNFDSSAVISTYNKLLSGGAVSCLLNAKYHIHSGPAVDATSPQITVFAMTEDNNSARVGYMRVYFNLWYDYGGFYGRLLIAISFNIRSDNTASVEYLKATKDVAWASAFV